MTALVLTYLLLLIQGAVAVHLEQLDVPGAVIRGEAVWLHCNYDLDGDQLYSVKWYKNNVEFYRYLPSDSPPGQKYDLMGLYVDLNRSNESHVYLFRTDLNTEGTFGCEVSAEAPSFLTVKAAKELRMYVLPKEGPTIEGVRMRYDVGDEVNVTCVSGPSKPASVLKWYINNKEAPSQYQIPIPVDRQHDGLQGSASRLMFMVDHGHFRNGVMKMRCTASISQIYSMSSEELVIGYKGSSTGMPRAGGDGPIITGGQAKYQVGDLVDLNCTSGNSSLPVELKWFINDKQAPTESVILHPSVRFGHGVQAFFLGLRFRVQQRHFHTDEMRLKCTATLSKIINMSSEETVMSSSQQSSGLHVPENTGSVRNRGTPDFLPWWALSLLLLASVLL